MLIEKNTYQDLVFNIVRDDLYPHFFGGNKARKMGHIIADIEKKNNNAVVTTGGIHSNHCRVVALACAAKGWECKLVLHGTKHDFLQAKGNALLMRLTGAGTVFVEPHGIGPAMDAAMEELKRRGLRPYYLYGGGHNRAGVMAYAGAVKEFKNRMEPGYEPGHIFLASGTGSTQAGILAGCRSIGWENTRVHGISVARKRERGVAGVLEALRFIQNETTIQASQIDFYDDFLFGGYGKYSRDLKQFALDVARYNGIIVDTTYSAKALFGMFEIIKKENLTGNIVFWHTGGLFNAMA